MNKFSNLIRKAVGCRLIICTNEPSAKVQNEITNECKQIVKNWGI